MQKLIKFIPTTIKKFWTQIGLALCLAILLSLVIRQNAAMQSQPEDDWIQPVNLTNSGSAADPILLVDSENITHAIWLDQFEGYQHAESGQDGVWSEPRDIIVPFDEAGQQPRVILGPNDLVYAFWLEDEYVLYSRVMSYNVGLSVAWSPAQVLASDALTFDVFIDVDQAIHLAYIMESDVTAQDSGVYYLQKPAGRGWTRSEEIYTSQYFRIMRSDQAHVSVAAGYLTEVEAIEGEATASVDKQIFVAWDEAFMFRSMVSTSIDGSAAWANPVEIDPGQATNISSMPFEPDLTVWNQQVLLVWKRKLSETTCEIMYKVASGEADWSEVKENFSSSNGCPEQTDFVMQSDDLSLWHAEIGNQIIFTAWNGSDWSEPRSETGLTGFQDQITGQTLSLGNRNLFYQESTNSLLAVGTDLNGRQDVWFTHRSLIDMQGWFLPYSSWEPVEEVAIAPYGASSIQTLTDEAGNIQTLWVQNPLVTTESLMAGRDLENSVYYSNWNGVNWSEPSVVVTDTDGGLVEMSVAANSAGDLMMLWRKETGCQISFTSVSADRVFNSWDWMEPVNLPTPVGMCSSPTLVVGHDDSVFAVYALAVNENRGIYLNRSYDGGRSWEEPVQVFDAQAALWEMVDQPVLIVSESRLHMLWQRGLPLESGMGQGLGYAYSDDDGLTWNVSDTSVQEKLKWAGIVISTDGVLLRAWQQESDEQPVISTQVSMDSGQSWEPAISITCFGEILGKPKLITDPDGGIHLVQVVNDSLGKSMLHHWSWDGKNWAARDSLHLGYDLAGNSFVISAVISPQEQLAVLYTVGNHDKDLQVISAALSQIDSDGIQAETVQNFQEVLSPTNQGTALMEGETQAQPHTATVIPTESVSLSNFVEENPSSMNVWIGLILGAIIALIVVVALFWVRIFRNKI